VCRQSEKKLIKQQYILHISSQYGEPRRINGWGRLVSLGHPSKFERISRLGFITAPTSLKGDEPNFARCLAVSWPGTLYTFWGLLLPNGICQAQNSLCVQILWSCVLLYWQRYCTALEHWTSAKLSGVQQTTPSVSLFGTAAITLGIDPHSSYSSFCLVRCVMIKLAIRQLLGTR